MQKTIFSPLKHLDCISRIFPIRGAIVVGAGRGEGSWFEMFRESDSPVLLVEAEAERSRQLQRDNADRSNWQVQQLAVSDRCEESSFNLLSNPSESGLLPVEELTDLWPNLKLKQQIVCRTVTLSDLAQQVEFEPNWLIVDCLHALSILQGAEAVLPGMDVVIVRVLADQSLCPTAQSAHDDVDSLMDDEGFSCLGLTPERHPSLAHAVYVRNYASIFKQQQAEHQNFQEQFDQLSLAKTSAEYQNNDLHLQLAILNKAGEEQTRLASEKQSHIQQLTEKLDEQAKQADECQQQFETLNTAKTDAETLVSELKVQIDELTNARDEQAKLATELQNKIVQVDQAKSGVDQLATHLQKELERLRQELTESANVISETEQARQQVLQEVEQLKQNIQELNNGLEQLQNENQALKKETILEPEEKSRIYHQALFDCPVLINDTVYHVGFNSKDPSTFKVKDGKIYYSLPDDKIAYLVSTESGSFDHTPGINQIPVETDTAYELSALINYNGSHTPIVWMFEYDEGGLTKKKSFTVNEGHLKIIFKTKLKTTRFALGIRLGGQGSIDLETLRFQLQSSPEISLKADLNSQLGEIQSSLDSANQKLHKKTLKQLENFVRLQTLMGDTFILPEMHNWPISPDLGVLLSRLIGAGNYDYIIEFGSGVSTVIIAKTLSFYSIKTQFCSFEHLDKYYQETLDLLDRSKLRSNVDLQLSPLTPYAAPDGNTYNYYDYSSVLQRNSEQFSGVPLRVLVFVDGPPAATGPLARYPALPVVWEAFPVTAEFDFLLDDYVREDEREIIGRWESFLSEHGAISSKKEYSDFEKQACLLKVRRGNQ